MGDAAVRYQLDAQVAPPSGSAVTVMPAESDRSQSASRVAAGVPAEELARRRGG